jgi:pilus assembly protein CpaE
VIIAFLGTKGGTGTTTIAVNCAADVHRLTRRSTLVLDARQSPGDVAVLLGMRPRYSLVDLIEQLGWSERALASRFVAEHASGLHLLAASEALGRPDARDADAVEQTLACLTSMYDFVIVDAGSALSASAVSAVTAADLVVLVANPDVPCLRNLQRLSDALRLAGVAPERTRVLLNRTSESSVLPPAHIEHVLGRRIDFQLVSDYRAVAAAVNAGVPLARLRPTELQGQMETMARSLVGLTLAVTS